MSSHALSSLPQPAHPITIRAAAATDHGAVAAIYTHYIERGDVTFDGGPFTAGDVARMQGRLGPREHLLVAEVDGAVVGWGAVKLYSERIGYARCCESSIYLDPGQRRRGYGRQLQQRLMELVAREGFHHVVAKIVATNSGSIAFHQRFGFEVVGCQKQIGFVNGRWHDVVIMQCLLNSP